MTAGAKHIIQESIAIAFILLFTYTGINKLMERDRFLYSLAHSPALAPMSGLISYLIPLIEVALAFFLILPRYRKYAFQLSVLLMLAFTLYIGLMLIFSTELPCSCGGVISRLSWEQHLLFNIFFLLLGIAGYRYANYSTS